MPTLFCIIWWLWIGKCLLEPTNANFLISTASVFTEIKETLRKRRRLEDVTVISKFFRGAHAQMSRLPHKQTFCWRRLLQNCCFQGFLTFVQKDCKEKVNKQHLLLNSVYVVVFIMSSNFLSYSSNYSVVKSNLFICLSAKTTILFAQAVKGLKKPLCFFSLNKSTKLTKFCLK